MAADHTGPVGKQSAERTDEIPWRLLFFLVTPGAVALAVFGTYVIRPPMTDRVRKRIAAAEETAHGLTATRDNLQERVAALEATLHRTQQEKASAERTAREAQAQIARLRARLDDTPGTLHDRLPVVVPALALKPEAEQTQASREDLRGKLPSQAAEQPARLPALDLGSLTALPCRVIDTSEEVVGAEEYFDYVVLVDQQTPPPRWQLRSLAEDIANKVNAERFHLFTVYYQVRGVQMPIGEAYAAANFEDGKLTAFSVAPE